MSALVLAARPRPSYASHNVKQRRIVARTERSEGRVRLRSSNGAPGFHFVQSGLRSYERKKGSGTPADALSHVPHASGARGAPRKGRLAPPSAYGRARLPAFHHGSRQGTYVTHGAAQAMLPGTRSERALPAIAYPSPVSTSRAGPSAGRLMPEPPESGGDEAPPAGTALAPAARHHRTASLRARFDSRRNVTDLGTGVKGVVVIIVTNQCG
jgi:hypothetical protein